MKRSHTADDFGRIRVGGKAVEHVRRGHHVCDSVAGSNPGHLQRLLQRARAVVNAGQNVGMDVDHRAILLLIMGGPHENHCSSDGLDRVGIHLGGHGPLQQVDAQHQTCQTLFPNQDTFTSGQGTRFDADATPDP